MNVIISIYTTLTQKLLFFKKNKRVGSVSNNAKTIVVCGDRKRGKSALINSLIAEVLLPQGLELTDIAGVPILLRYGAKKRIYSHNGDPENMKMEEIYEEDFREVFSMTGTTDINYFRIELPNKFLKKGYEFIELPDLFSGQCSHPRISLCKSFLSDASTVFLVCEAMMPLSRNEVNFCINELLPLRSQTAIVLTKTDLIFNESHLEAMTEDIKHKCNIPYNNIEIFSCSSKLKQLYDNSKSDITDLRESGYGILQKYIKSLK